MSRDNAPEQPGDADRVVVPLRADAARSRSRHPSAQDVTAADGDADVLDFTGEFAGDAPTADAESAPSAPDTPPPRPSGAESLRPARRPSADAATDPDAGWQRTLADALALLRRRLEGDYEVDDFGFDPEFAGAVLLPALELLYDHWFRVEVNGAENVPVTGGALIVANHAGGLWPVDGAMLAVAVHRESPEHRFLRPLAADLLFGLPAAGMLARRGGTVPARRDDAARLLRAGELVGVWPEGFAGIGKPFRERYQLQRFGRGGFVRSAIRAQVPLVPVSVVGSEEIHPVLGRSATLARLLGLPYFPFTPTFPWLGPLGLVPLPSKWYIEFGDPLPTDALDPSLADDPETVFDLTDRVRDTIQATLHRLLLQRRSVWR